MLLLSALCALTVMLWPRRPRVMAGMMTYRPTWGDTAA